MTDETLPLARAAGHDEPSPFREFVAAFSLNRGAVVGVVGICLLIVIALCADFIAPYSPILTSDSNFLKPPAWQAGGSVQHVLGTDAIGRDMLSRLIYGARLSLSIGLGGVALSVVFGIALGLIAGFARGIVEISIMRLMDIVLTLPSLLLAIVIV